MDSQPPPRSSFISPTLRSVGLLLALTLLFACAVTPSVQSALIKIMGETRWPFSRVFDRVALAGVIIFAYVLRRDLRLNELFAGRKGWHKPRVLRTVLVATCISFFMALAGLPFVVDAGKGMWTDKTTTELLLRVAEVAPAALIISLIEESFFRGLVFRRLITEVGTTSAVVLSSMLYAVAHVTASNRHWVYEGWSPTAGFEYFGTIFVQAWHPQIGMALIGLFFVGATLCLVRQRSGGLAACIGLHAGWVLSVKVGRFMMKEIVEVPLPRGAGRYFLLTLPVVWVSIGAVALISWFLFRAPRQAGDD